jgi:hypothetical protein
MAAHSGLRVALGGLIAAMLTACGGGGSAAFFASPTNAPGSATPQFVGYWVGWSQNNLTQVARGIGTVIISFYFVNGHSVVPGNVQPQNLSPQDIAALHQRGVKVLLSLGGADPPNAFVFDGDVPDFETSLASVMQQYGFDGVDFDDESGTQQQRNTALATLIPATRTYFDTHGMANDIITYAAFETPQTIDDAWVLAQPGVAQALSWINVMSYDYTQAENDLQLYAQIFDKHRLMLGNENDGGAPMPSPQTLQQLAAWVKTNGYGGMMLWICNPEVATSAQIQAIEQGLGIGG